MKKRYLYSVLFGVPGLLFSFLVTFLIFGSISGLLWIFIFGDDPWPASVRKTLPFLFILTLFVLWLGFITAGFLFGKNREDVSGLDRKHIMISAASTLVPIILFIFYQLKVGNIGPKSESRQCSDFCSGKGFFVSSIPPQQSGERTCSCLDDRGREIMKVPLDSLIPTNQ